MRNICLTLLLSVVFWNLENCFDYFDSGLSPADKEFSSFGQRHWNKKKFEKKTVMFGKTMLWAGLPQVIGVCEVENAFVMRRLCRSEALHKCSYRFVHFDSPDARGIDVGLCYLSDSLSLVRAYPVRLDSLGTRDILYVELVEKAGGCHWHFFVNHHPSKYGGASSAPRRRIVMEKLRRCTDSLIAAGADHIVAMGDFNDVPSAEAFSIMDGSLVNLGKSLEHSNFGSIRYRGNWQLIDNFLVSADMARIMEMEVLRPPFLLERDRQWPGEKPLRTYVGPRYKGGVSDHLPVRLKPSSPSQDRRGNAAERD